MAEPVTVAPTVFYVGCAIGSAAGGTALDIYGLNFASNATVTVGGSAATSVVRQNSTHISCVTPAHAVGVVDIVVTNPGIGSDPYSNGFEYLPVAVVVKEDDFGNSSPGDFTLVEGADAESYDGSFYQSTSRINGSYAGGKSLKGNAYYSLNYSTNDNWPLNKTNGLWTFCRMATDLTTLQKYDGTALLQTKLHLCRKVSGSTQRWLVLLAGTAGNCLHGELAVVNDNSGTDATKIPFGFSPLVWVDFWINMKRAGSVGTARMWVNGHLFKELSNANLGNDEPATANKVQWGPNVNEVIDTTDMVWWIDRMIVADGFVEGV